MPFGGSLQEVKLRVLVLVFGLGHLSYLKVAHKFGLAVPATSLS
jgi:hypothetical protein